MNVKIKTQRIIENSYAEQTIRKEFNELIETDNVMFLYEFHKFNKKIAKHNKKCVKQVKKGNDVAFIEVLNAKEFKEVLYLVATISMALPINFLATKLIKALSSRNYGELHYESALEIVLILAKLDYVNMDPFGSGMVMIEPANKNVGFLNKEFYFRAAEFIPPMVAEPKTIVDTEDSPYYTKHHKNSLILKNRKMEVTRKSEKFFEALNKLNKIPLTLNRDVIALDEGEFYSKKKKHKNVRREFSKAKEIYRKYSGIPFYLPWYMDARSRMYQHGYHINFQGSDYKRASVELYEKEALTEEGLYWLKIGCANSFKPELSREPFEKRIAWYEEHGETVDWRDAEDRYHFYSYRQVIRRGVGTMTGILVGLDASSSGTQLLAVMANCKKSMKKCNLIYNGKFNDAPMIILNRFKSYFKGKKLPKRIKKVSRKVMKKVYMTRLYGSVASPRQLFRKDKYINAFYRSIAKELPGVSKLMNHLLKLSSNKAKSYKYTSPDGFICNIIMESKETIYYQFHSLGRSVAHVVRTNEVMRLTSIVANVVHTGDAFIVRYMVRKLDFPILPVHDAIYCHPNNCGKIQPMYNKALSKLRKCKYISKVTEKLGRKFYPEKAKNKIDGKYSIS